MNDLRVVDVADMTPTSAAFVALDRVDRRPVRWQRHSGLPRSAVERKISRPRLSRYRAAFEGARDAAAAHGIISHLPRMTAAVADAGRLIGPLPSHLAFSFNFTELPGSLQRRRMAAAFARVDQFCVYSRFEAGLYADAFGVDPARFKPLLWAQPTPALAIGSVALPPRPFVVAVGGEGRDFATLLAAARRLPAVDFLIIARDAADFANAPANVSLRFNITSVECWTLAAAADALLVPLVSAETCCGHLTIVSGRLLGLPIITTASRGTLDYTDGFGATMLVPPRDADALAGAIEALRADLSVAHADADRDREVASRLYDRARWSDYVADWLRTAVAAS